MFTLTPHQLKGLEARADDAFVETLRAFLAQEYPAFLPRFPVAVQVQLTRGMLERAEAAGAQTQQSIGQWCLLMLVMGPNLGRDPAIRAWLASTGASADQRIRELDHLLSEADWARIDTHREDLPLLTPMALDDADLPTRTQAALPMVLWEHERRADDRQLAQEACTAASRLGLQGLADAPLALALAQTLYGSALASRPDWLTALQDTRHSARSRLEMLRARIMLDHGRWA
jgi:hypothetical protein